MLNLLANRSLEWMDVMKTVLSSLRAPAALLLLPVLLQACGGRYQAPLDDQSTVLERTSPPIYSTDGSSAGNRVASAPAANSRPAASTNAARTVAAGVRVQPAPGVNVNVVNDTGAIRRTTIDRAPIVGGGSAIAAPTPAPAPTPTTLEPSPVAVSSGQTHTVVRGDTLYSIAWRYSLDSRALALANNLAPPYTIYPNQVLNVDIANVSDNALRTVPTIPAEPAGDPAVAVGQRPAAAVANRRTDNVTTRLVEGVTWQWPLEGRVLRGFSTGSAATSRGIDIGGSRGDAVYAAADGDVVYSGRGIQGQGDLIIIRHSARHLSAYSHNSNMLVSEGARVQAGDKISEVGTDPRGSELIHFEVRVDGKPVDPTQYLPSR